MSASVSLTGLFSGSQGEGWTHFWSIPACAVVSSGHVGLKLVQPLWRMVWILIKKLKIELAHDPEIPHPETYTNRKLLQSWSAKTNDFHLFHFTTLALWLRGGLQKQMAWVSTQAVPLIGCLTWSK